MASPAWRPNFPFLGCLPGTVSGWLGSGAGERLGCSEHQIFRSTHSSTAIPVSARPARSGLRRRRQLGALPNLTAA